MNSILKIKPLGFPWETSDPFLFCAYHEDRYPEGNQELGPAVSLEGRIIGQDFEKKDGWRMYHGSKVPGFPAHPHRGFETVTIVHKGLVDHSDSLGAAGRFGNGDAQWMTAGKGILHAEMFPLLNQDTVNPFLLFQIWLNLPKAHKMVTPHFKMLWNETIPEQVVTDENGKQVFLKMYAGSMQETAPAPPPHSWAADADNEVAIWTIHMEANSSYTFPIATEGVNRSLYFYEGDTLHSEGYEIPVDHRIITNPVNSLTITNGNTKAKLLLLQGKPIDEPVAKHGPFVMNTMEEIRQAMADYQQTQYGGWPWATYEHVHDREKGRFAQFADGTVEIK